jgi:glycosyltransferase involved in cell wall biosynthesis
MKLIQITAKKFPANTADHIFLKKSVYAFSKLLNKDYQFICLNCYDNSFENINYINIGSTWTRGITFYLFLWVPYFIFKNKIYNQEIWFYSNDLYILSILIFWKKLFSMKFCIASEWHMLISNYLDGYVSRNSDKLITTTKHLKNILIKSFNIESSKVQEIYGGVEIDPFQNLRNTNISGMQDKALIKLGYIGYYKTMGMEKGLSTIIESLKYLDKKIHAYLVGGRKDEIEGYKILAGKIGVFDRVEFIPTVEQSEIPKYFENMDIVIIPYPNKKHFRDYGLPMKIYEYMASKKIIVYSKLPVIDELLHDCAVSFEPDNSQDLANKIAQIINNRENFDALVDRAHAKVLNYSWDKRSENIVRFLGKI